MVYVYPRALHKGLKVSAIWVPMISRSWASTGTPWQSNLPQNLCLNSVSLSIVCKRKTAPLPTLSLPTADRVLWCRKFLRKWQKRLFWNISFTKTPSLYLSCVLHYFWEEVKIPMFSSNIFTLNLQVKKKQLSGVSRCFMFSFRTGLKKKQYINL